MAHPMVEQSEPLTCFELMRSLDEAFMVRQGMGNNGSAGWGHEFFRLLDESQPEWRTERVAVYMKACELLYRFALSERGEELGAMIYHRPETLLRTAILLLKPACGYERPAGPIFEPEA